MAPGANARSRGDGAFDRYERGTSTYAADMTARQSTRHASHQRSGGLRLARLVLLGGACALAACGLAQANTQAFASPSQNQSQLQASTGTPPKTDTQAQPQTLASTWGGAKLLKVQAQIVPLSDNSLANASAGFLPTPLAIARPPGQGSVVLWDEIRIRPPVASTANGVVTITINGK